MQLDKKDRRLLYEIDLDARLGTSALGKKIGLSQEGTYYRLQRLQRKDIIRAYTTLLNFSALGYTGYGVYARFHAVNQDQKKRIIEDLKRHDHIYWIAEFGGKYDISFGIVARDIVHFNDIYTEIVTRHNTHLKDFTPAIRVQLTQFPRTYLLQEKHRKDKAPQFGSRAIIKEIDELDKSILRAIATDARTPSLEIARTLGKPASTVASRIKNLEEVGIIQCYSALINCQQFGYESFQLFITAHSMTKENRRKFVAYCRQHPSIIFCVETVGKWSFEIIYEVEDQKAFQEMLIEIRTVFSDIIQDIESINLFDHHVKYDQYPLKS